MYGLLYHYILYLISFLSHNHQSWNLLVFFSTLGALQLLQTISVCSQVGQSSPKSETKFFAPRQPDEKPDCHTSLTSPPYNDGVPSRFFSTDFVFLRIDFFSDLIFFLQIWFVFSDLILFFRVDLFSKKKKVPIYEE